MTDSTQFLFVGGPLHGQRLATDSSDHWDHLFRPPIGSLADALSDPSPPYQVFTYVRRRIASDRLRWTVYTPEDIPEEYIARWVLTRFLGPDDFFREQATPDQPEGCACDDPN